MSRKSSNRYRAFLANGNRFAVYRNGFANTNSTIWPTFRRAGSMRRCRYVFIRCGVSPAWLFNYPSVRYLWQYWRIAWLFSKRKSSLILDTFPSIVRHILYPFFTCFARVLFLILHLTEEITHGKLYHDMSMYYESLLFWYNLNIEIFRWKIAPETYHGAKCNQGRGMVIHFKKAF